MFLNNFRWKSCDFLQIGFLVLPVLMTGTAFHTVVAVWRISSALSERTSKYYLKTPNQHFRQMLWHKDGLYKYYAISNITWLMRGPFVINILLDTGIQHCSKLPCLAGQSSIVLKVATVIFKIFKAIAISFIYMEWYIVIYTLGHLASVRAYLWEKTWTPFVGTPVAF